MECTTGENCIHPAAVEYDYNHVPFSIDTVSHQTADITWQLNELKR